MIPISDLCFFLLLDLLVSLVLKEKISILLISSLIGWVPPSEIRPQLALLLSLSKHVEATKTKASVLTGCWNWLFLLEVVNSGLNMPFPGNLWRLSENQSRGAAPLDSPLKNKDLKMGDKYGAFNRPHKEWLWPNYVFRAMSQTTGLPPLQCWQCKISIINWWLNKDNIPFPRRTHRL